MADNLKTSLIQAYLRDLDAPRSDTSTTLVFGYIPEEFSESKTANWNLVDIPGRSEPIVGYVNSTVREFSLTLLFMAGVGQSKYVNAESGYVDTGTSVDDDDARAVKKKVDWIRSLTYPDYDNPNFVRPPHRVLLCIGKLIKSVCVVSTVGVNYKAPWDENLLPLVAEVSLTLQEVNKVPPGYTEVRNGLLSSYD